MFYPEVETKIAEAKSESSIIKYQFQQRNSMKLVSYETQRSIVQWISFEWLHFEDFIPDFEAY